MYKSFHEWINKFIVHRGQDAAHSQAAVYATLWDSVYKVMLLKSNYMYNFGIIILASNSTYRTNLKFTYFTMTCFTSIYNPPPHPLSEWPCDGSHAPLHCELNLVSQVKSMHTYLFKHTFHWIYLEDMGNTEQGRNLITGSSTVV